MTGRTINGAAYTLAYNAENRLTGVSGSSSAVYVYDGDGNRVKETTYRNLAAGIPVTVASGVTLLNPGAVTNGDTWADSSDPNTGEFAATSPDGTRYVQIDLGAVYMVDKVKVWHYTESGNPYTYHDPKTEVSIDGSTWYTVSGSGEYQETADGKTYTFTARTVRYIRDTINGSNRNANNRWVEIEAWGNASTTFVGNYFEWASNSDGLTNTGSTNVYYAAGQRLAIRRTGYASGGNELLWLLSDHLGSTTVTAYANGSFYSELRYTPWGETRYSSQSGMILPPGSQNRTPTSFRFTGQRSEEDAIGLYYYNARWYDPYLNRWISPDTIIPDPYNPQDWDRFAYVRNNPINFNDPTGRSSTAPIPTGLQCGPDNIYCGGLPGDIPSWDKNSYKFISPIDRRRAEIAYNHLLNDPTYFAGLYALPDSWGSDIEVRYLEVFAEYSTLHTTASDLVLREFGGWYGYTEAAHVSELRQINFGNSVRGNGLTNLLGVLGLLAVVRPGQPGLPDHVNAVNNLTITARKMWGGNYDVKNSVSIYSSGFPIDRRPDVSVWENGEVRMVYEAARVDANGELVKREYAKKVQYDLYGIDYEFDLLP